MDIQTIAQLHSLNKQFYQTFGRAFSSTRMWLQPGVKKVLDRLSGDENILDLGCGNGELARELNRRGHGGFYLGMDFSPVLLQDAGKITGNESFGFIQGDLLEPGWESQVTNGGNKSYDWVISFAVLHHIPGKNNRLEILKKIHALLRPGGCFIHSEWQFLNSAKLRERIQPWSKAGIPEDALEPNDYLLDWRSGGRGLRYVHAFNETELSSLAETGGYKIMETFQSDGSTGNLGLYQIWEAV
jgi:tRNA (uracil-5-)-methyltransferase TRM9